MKREIFIVIIFSVIVFVTDILLISFVCGVPWGNRTELNRYLFGEGGIQQNLTKEEKESLLEYLEIL